MFAFSCSETTCVCVKHQRHKETWIKRQVARREENPRNVRELCLIVLNDASRNDRTFRTVTSRSDLALDDGALRDTASGSRVPRCLHSRASRIGRASRRGVCTRTLVCSRRGCQRFHARLIDALNCIFSSPAEKPELRVAIIKT